MYVEKNINDSFLFIKIFIHEYAYNKNIENNSDLKGISLKKEEDSCFNNTYHRRTYYRQKNLNKR